MTNLIATDIKTYEPTNQNVLDIWVRLLPATREKLFNKAQQRLELINALESNREHVSERKAADKIQSGVNRTTIRDWRERYELFGFDGLIDLRMGPCRKLDSKITEVICTLRRVNADISVDDIIAYLKKHHDVKIGGTSVKKVLRENGLNRPRGISPGMKRKITEHPLTFGGIKLLEAALVETGYIEALSNAVIAYVDNIPRPEIANEVDISGRDSNGRFLPEYNERNRKGPDDKIGPAFVSVAQKRENMNIDRLEIAEASQEVVERKLIALMSSPLLGNGRGDGMRTTQAGILLNEVCGYPYMPATLDRFTRELKYAGVAATLWEVHAMFSQKLSQECGENRRDAILYIDGTTKPVWTNLFSQSTKVSMLGRTMPGLDIVAFHSGNGVPLWMLTHSGRATLVKVIPDAMKRLDEICGPASVGRVVVIDAEANSIPFLKGLEQGESGQAWVTRLRDDWAQNKRIFNKGNYRPYRNGDRVRMGVADFNDPEIKKGKFRMRVIEVERRNSGKITYLGASMLLNEKEWNAASIADVYFERWPNQEADFRAVNQATGFKEVHGYGKQLVDNVSVITEIDDLVRKSANAQQRYDRRTSALNILKENIHEEKKLIGCLERRQDTVDRHIKAEVIVGKSVTTKVQHLLEEQRNLKDAVSNSREKLESNKSRYDKISNQQEKTINQLEKYAERQKKLKGRKKIFAHDVELDSLFTLLKVGLVLMVAYVLREYLGNELMEATKFLERIATLPARQSFTKNYEIITFAYNQRDPEVIALLKKYSQAINDRGLRMRSGRKLMFAFDPDTPNVNGG
jgi:transposase